MKNLILTSVIALGVAAPAFAQTQLERAVGAEAGQYTTSELVLLYNVTSESANEARVYIKSDTETFSGSGNQNAVAERILAQIAAESRGADD